VLPQELCIAQRLMTCRVNSYPSFSALILSIVYIRFKTSELVVWLGWPNETSGFWSGPRAFLTRENDERSGNQVSIFKASTVCVDIERVLSHCGQVLHSWQIPSK